MNKEENKVVILFNGKKYVADDETHIIDIYEDETGAELKVYKQMTGSLYVQLKAIK